MFGCDGLVALGTSGSKFEHTDTAVRISMLFLYFSSSQWFVAVMTAEAFRVIESIVELNSFAKNRFFTFYAFLARFFSKACLAHQVAVICIKSLINKRCFARDTVEALGVPGPRLMPKVLDSL